MARINLMKEILEKRLNKNRVESLEKMTSELIQAGADKDKITQILKVRENLSPEEEQAVLTFISKQ